MSNWFQSVGRRAQQGRNYVQILPVSESVEGIWQEPACFSAGLTISGNITQGRTGFQHHTLAAAVRRSRQEPPNWHKAGNHMEYHGITNISNITSNHRPAMTVYKSLNIFKNHVISGISLKVML
jgi:hypothetical protein